MKRLILVLLILGSGFINSFADEANEEMDLEKIVITPTRTEEKVTSIGATVSVLNAKELEKRGIYTVKDALKKDFGIDVTQAGSFGGSSSIFLRGANSGQTRVMIDGVRVYDPISTNAAFDPAYLTLDNVERIEIVKGPQSSLYGADAIGGVINIITKKGKGRPKTSIFGEGGTYDTQREVIEFNGEKDKLHFAFSNSYFKTKGISKASKWYGNSEEDPYENQSYSLRLDYDFYEDLSIGLINRFTYAKYEYDDARGTGGDDPNIKGWTKQGINSVFLNQKLSDLFEHKIQLSWMGNFRRDFDEDDSVDTNDYLRDWYYGETYQAEWQGNYRLFEFDNIVAGFNYLRERGESYYFLAAFPPASIFPKNYAWTKGWFIENRFNFEDKFSSTWGYRYEDHSRFKNSSTYSIDAKYKIDKTNTSIKGSIGTGFKAPTLYQLYAPSTPDPFGFGGGNTNLEPEKSESYDIGFEQQLFDNKLMFSIVYFHNIFKNLIDALYNSDTGHTDQYRNVSKARSFGYESQLKINLTKNFTIQGNYTWMVTEDKETHLDLLRRANNKFNLDFNYKFLTKFNFNLGIDFVGHRFDAGNIKLKPYTKVNFASYYDINNNFRFYTRIENVFNEKYEELYGYGTPGASIYAGIKAKF